MENSDLLNIKKELRAAMNGILSAKMREAGAPYKLVFGVELPRLQNIASEFKPSRILAQQLWNENIRESKLLATMLMPPQEFLPEIADIWVDEIPTAEVAQVLVMHLLCKEPWCAITSFEWIASSSPMRQLCGFLCIARLLQQGAQLNERSVSELKDQAQSLLPNADLSLRKAIIAAISFI
ncbi:MAG: DNA alkylation repair protein [Bacteroidaceae bacterium]|nr:DNA alkylation repair protein [Bacteroidaceae bacterium]